MLISENLIDVNDVVVRKNNSTKPLLWKVIGISNVFNNSFVCKADNELLHHFDADELRKATKAELVAGNRLCQK